MMEVYGSNFSLELMSWIGIVIIIFLLSVSFCVSIIMRTKKKIVEMNHSHEERMKTDEWNRKIEWETKIFSKNDSSDKNGSSNKPEDDMTDKEKALKKEIEELEKKAQSDLVRIALFVYFSCNSRECWTPGKTDKLIEQVKNTQEAIKKYLDMKL